jgi:Ankyrin repeat
VPPIPLPAAASLLALALFAAARAAAAPPGCEGAITPIDRLVCAEPELNALDAAVTQALTAAPAAAAGERQWRGGRAAACPAAAVSSDAAHGIAVVCLARIYEQRLAVLRDRPNAAAWPQLRFRPRLVEGAGTRLCEDLQRDIVAGFLGPAGRVDPLGERQIGFVPMPGLGDERVGVRRADIDAYNAGKPFPVLEWVEAASETRPETIEYRGYASQNALLAAVGRGVEPLTQSVRAAGAPIVEVAKLPRLDPQKPEPRAAFAGRSVLPRDESPHFFRYDGRTYLMAPMDPVPGVAGDLGVYHLYGPAQLHRVCLFEAHVPLARGAPDPALALPQIAALRRAAAPLLPTGRLCRASGDEARALADHAAWRPWVLEWPTPGGDALSPGRLARYMRNRALLGPEESRAYQIYFGARAEAVEALAPFYRRQFGRTAADAEKLAGLYLDRLVADGFEFDPDDEATAALFSAGYADAHLLERAALAGDVAALKAGLGADPRAAAAQRKASLGESLVTDALEHPMALATLLDLGLDPNARGPSGRTPLMVAARLDLVAAAQILLAHGARLDIGAGDAVAQTDRSGDPLCMTGENAAADTPGRTALSYAAEDASPALVRLLLDHGAAAGAADSAGRRPFDYLRQRHGDPAETRAIAALLKPR